MKSQGTIKFDDKQEPHSIGKMRSKEALEAKTSRDHIDEETRLIIEDGTSQGSAYGLPSIGGAIS